MLVFIILVVIAYLLGSVSSAIIICKLMQLPDPRSTGSQNPGATNVLRIADKKTAALVLLGDILKGVIPVLLGHLFGLTPVWLGLIGFVAVVGHMYPVFFEFKGGKGIATAFGVLIALNWWLAVIALIVWLVVAKIFRYSSLASLSAMLVTTIACLFIQMGYFWGLLLITVLSAWRHSDNIKRLLAGNESKL